MRCSDAYAILCYGVRLRLSDTASTRVPKVTALVRTKRKRPRSFLNVAFINAGNDLLSHTLSRAVPSAQRGLTSVFGMGTGGSPAVRLPTTRSCLRSAVSSQQLVPPADSSRLRNSKLESSQLLNFQFSKLRAES